MKKLKIEELKKNLFIGDFGEYFIDYKAGYICDIISEIADNQVDFYYSDLFEWAKGNTSYIEEAADEFGSPTDSKGHFDFIKCIQQGQYYAYEQNLYENLEDSIKFFIYDYIEKELKIAEITEEQNDNLLEWNFDDNNEELENLIEHIENILIKENKEESED